MKNKKILFLMLSAIMLISYMTGCGKSEAASGSLETSYEHENTNGQKENDTEECKKVEKTAVQSQGVRYVPIEEVGTYNENIITPELVASCTLPHLDKAALPYWTGLILEDKIFVNVRNDGWDEYTGGGWYWNEEEIRYMSQNGFNCVRVCYSLSFLSNPENVMEINVSELEQLDELISWCIKYNMHLILSQTGLPGKWNSWGDNWHEDVDYAYNEENVVVNTELYTSKEMQNIYLRYFEMLAKRYQNISNGVLSFEFAVENTVPENDMHLQAEVLGPVAQAIWSYTPDRILFANDSERNVPRELAEMGCCISLHSHIYSLDGTPLTSEYGVKYTPKWPMPYLPFFANENSNPLILKADEAFSEGELRLYLEWRNALPSIIIDGKTVVENSDWDPLYEPEVFNVKIPNGAKSIEIRFNGDITMLGLSILQGEDMVSLVSHGVNNGSIYMSNPEVMPTLLVNKDLTITDISENPVTINAEYMEKIFLSPFIETARECGVSFVMTEIGSDSAGVLIPEKYCAYEKCWLDALRKNNIGWMYNCIHNILAPDELMWLNENNSLFTDITEVPDMYGYCVNNTVMNLLKSYSGN